MLVSQFPKSPSATAVVILSLLFHGVQGQYPVINSTQDLELNSIQALTGFPPCDALIAANLSHAVHFPSSPLYSSLVNGSWALSGQTQPWCFVLPSSAEEVSQTLTALRSAGNGAGDWHVAVRSGGHASDNSNSIVQGVTIDLTQLNATSYDEVANIASVGTGARWGNVYADLETHGVSVTGGREAVVGVGGLVLGGGVGWTTARTGYACDSVINFEVVLAAGQIINANASSHPDLWRALKGGGSNFGIVTRFDFEAFPANNLTIQRRTIAPEHAVEVVDAIVGFTNLDQSFQDNAMLTIVSYNPQVGNISINVTEVNTVNDANSTAFEAFDRIPTLIPGTRESLTLSMSSNRSEVPGGTVGAGAGPLTIINDPRVLRYCLDQHADLVEDLTAIVGPQNFRTIMDFQPFPSYLADIGVQKGGNMLGLERDSRNKLLFIGSATLTGPNGEEQYPQAYQQVAAMTQRIKAFSESIGSSNEFIYMNYADATQDPLGSYGAANVEHMRQVANRYDPHGFFQRRVPGGFKIDRVD